MNLRLLVQILLLMAAQTLLQTSSSSLNCSSLSCPIFIPQDPSSSVQNNNNNNNTIVTVNVSFPFGTQPSCGASSYFLLSSDCQQEQELRWLGFANATTNSVDDQPLQGQAILDSSPFVMAINMADSRSNNCFPSYSDVAHTIDLAWNLTLASLNAADDDDDDDDDDDAYRHLICNPPSLYQIPDYLGSYSKINLYHIETIRANSSTALILDSYNTQLLLFNCSDALIDSDDTWEKNSSACQEYAADQNCSENDTVKKFGAGKCIRLNSKPCVDKRRKIDVRGWMNEMNCSHFQMKMGSERLGMMRLLWSPYHPQCPRCMESGGECGYESTTTLENFLCICPHGAFDPFVCNSGFCGKTCKLALLVCLPLASISIFAIVIGLIWFFLRRRRLHRRLLQDMTSLSTPLPSSNRLWTHRALALSSKFGPVSVKEFSYQELADATACFSDDNIIGDGGFGAVYLGLLKTGQKVAIKMLYHDNFQRLDQFYNEIRILSSFQHPSLVKLHGFCCQDSRDLLLVFEYASNGTVWDQLHCDDDDEEENQKEEDSDAASTKFPWETRLRVAYETADALSYMHNNLEPPIYHRDVKTTNILLDDHFHAKLADFGLSRLMPCGATHVTTIPQGSPGYVDPEYHHCYRLTDKSDVYSFGVVLMELVSARPAVDMSKPKGEINLSTLAMAKMAIGAWKELIDPSLHMDQHPDMEFSVKAVLELAFSCLQSEKDDRPTMKQVAETLNGIRRSLGYEGEDNFDLDIPEGDESFSKGGVQDPESSKLLIHETPRSTDSGQSTSWTENSSISNPYTNRS